MTYPDVYSDEVLQALTAAYEKTPIEGFEVVEFNHPTYTTKAFALVRADGAVWIVSVQAGKLELAR